MDLKINFCLTLLIYYVQTNDIEHKRHERSLKLLYDVLVDFTSDLKTAYSNAELSDAEDVAIAVVEAIPIIGDIIYMFTNDPDPPFDVKRALLTINDNLHILDRHIESVGDKVEEISKEINLSVLKNQVANAKLEISNCQNDFLLLLKTPESKAEQDRVKNCYSKFQYVRQIGSLLRNEKITFMTKPLFHQIIERRGYCYGTDIDEVFQYLLGIHIEGCTSLTTSEILSYGNETTTYQSECLETLQSARKTRANIYNGCKTDSCEKILPLMKRILNISIGDEIVSEFHKTFPWFHPIVILFRLDASSGVSYYDGNRLSFTTKDRIFRVLMWSADNTSTSGTYTYGVKFNTYAAYYEKNEMGLSKDVSGTTTSFTSSHYSQQLFCNETVDLENTYTFSTGIKDFDHTSQSNTLPGWIIGVVTAVGVFIIIGIGCLIKWRCTKNKEMQSKNHSGIHRTCDQDNMHNFHGLSIEIANKDNISDNCPTKIMDTSSSYANHRLRNCFPF